MSGVRYDHPTYTVVRQAAFSEDVGSATDFAVFRVRDKAIVTKVSYRCLSAPTVGGTLLIKKAFVALATSTIRSFQSTALSSATAGDSNGVLPTMETITLNSANTLASIGEGIAIRSDQGIGTFEIIYEYHLLP